jgi:hypothetical protein
MIDEALAKDPRIANCDYAEPGDNSVAEVCLQEM